MGEEVLEHTQLPITPRKAINQLLMRCATARAALMLQVTSTCCAEGFDMMMCSCTFHVQAGQIGWCPGLWWMLIPGHVRIPQSISIIMAIRSTMREEWCKCSAHSTRRAFTFALQCGHTTGAASGPGDTGVPHGRGQCIPCAVPFG
eukprot:344913-Pelagomonas_calceolata.AAC.8